MTQDKKQKAGPVDPDSINIRELLNESPLMQELKEKCTGEELEEALKTVHDAAEYYDGVIRMFRDNVKTEEDLQQLLKVLQSSK